MKAIDTNTKISYEVATQLKKQGYGTIIRYVGRNQNGTDDLTADELQAILQAGVSVGVVQHCPLPNWLPTKELGSYWGKSAGVFASKAGYKKGCIIYLDMEGIKEGTSKQTIIEYCNNWYEACEKEGYVAGIYVGANSWLTGDDLYYQLKFKHYWKSMSVVPPVTKRGYEMKQIEETILNGVGVDTNEYSKDNLDNSPIFMKADTTDYKKLYTDMKAQYDNLMRGLNDLYIKYKRGV